MEVEVTHPWELLLVTPAPEHPKVVRIARNSLTWGEQPLVLAADPGPWTYGMCGREGSMPAGRGVSDPAIPQTELAPETACPAGISWSLVKGWGDPEGSCRSPEQEWGSSQVQGAEAWHQPVASPQPRDPALLLARTSWQERSCAQGANVLLISQALTCQAPATTALLCKPRSGLGVGLASICPSGNQVDGQVGPMSCPQRPIQASPQGITI